MTQIAEMTSRGGLTSYLRHLRHLWIVFYILTGMDRAARNRFSSPTLLSL
jgi:hypothetical protein